MDIEELVGVSLDVPVPLAVESRENSLWVVGVFNDFPGIPFTPPDIEVLDCRELGPSDVLGCPQHPL